jgi:hypothetical protein
MSYRDRGFGGSSSSSSSAAASREASARCREYLVALAKTVALDLPEVLGDSDGPSGAAGAKQSERKNYYATLSEQLVSLGESQARLEKEIDAREAVIYDVLRSAPSSGSNSASSSSSSQLNEAELIKKAHKDVQAAVSTYDASSASVVRELEAMLRVRSPICHLLYTPFVA